MSKRRTFVPRILLSSVAALALAGSVCAQQPGQPGPGMGPGTGPGMMGGGMMGGAGPGYGPGGRGGYGPGGGMGSGMMGGGMMGLGPLGQLDLTDAQRSQVFKIQDETRRRNWELGGKMQDEQAKLRDAYLSSGPRDRAAILAAYRRIGDLRIQRIENALDASEKVEAVLTPQQREQVRRWGPWWMQDVVE